MVAAGYLMKDLGRMKNADLLKRGDSWVSSLVSKAFDEEY